MVPANILPADRDRGGDERCHRSGNGGDFTAGKALVSRALEEFVRIGRLRWTLALEDPFAALCEPRPTLPLNPASARACRPACLGRRTRASRPRPSVSLCPSAPSGCCAPDRAVVIGDAMVDAERTTGPRHAQRCRCADADQQKRCKPPHEDSGGACHSSPACDTGYFVARRLANGSAQLSPTLQGCRERRRRPRQPPASDAQASVPVSVVLTWPPSIDTW